MGTGHSIGRSWEQRQGQGRVPSRDGAGSEQESVLMGPKGGHRLEHSALTKKAKARNRSHRRSWAEARRKSGVVNGSKERVEFWGRLFPTPAACYYGSHVPGTENLVSRVP